MKTIERTYKIELTEEEIQTLADALDQVFEFNRVAYEDAESDGRKDDSKHYYSLCSDAYKLRNCFGNLIGRTFDN